MNDVFKELFAEEFEKCEAEAREKGMAKGIAEGIEKGIAEGRTEGRIELLIKKYKKGCTVEETADMLEEKPSIVQQIYDIIGQYAPDYDVEKICKAFLQKNTTQA